MCILDRRTREMLRASESPDRQNHRTVEMDGGPRPGVWRAPSLHPRNAQKLYDATSFLTWQYGLHFNAHLNIGFGQMGLDDQTAAAAMADFNKEARRYLAVAGAGRRLPDGRPRAGAPHHYVYVIEYGRNRGLHAHQLCVVPPGMKPAFERFAQRWWALEAGLVPACDRCRYPEHVVPGRPELRPGTRAARGLCPGLEGIHRCARYGADTLGRKMPDEAVMLVQPPTKWITDAHARAYAWLRYILKTTLPRGYAPDIDGTPRFLEEVLRLRLRPVPQPSDRCWPTKIAVPQMHGISQTLGGQAQAAAGFVSRLSDGRFDEVFSGWEIWAYLDRETRRTLKP